MKQVTTTPAATTVAQATDHEAAQQLREAFRSGRMGLQGAVACYPTLGVWEIIEVWRQERTAVQ